jgi:hypothetical protein
MRFVTADRSDVQRKAEIYPRFNYDEVPSSVAKFLKGQADRIRRQCTSSIIQIGKSLLESKRYLSHGAFLRWVEHEVGVPTRTAQAYMRVANWASGKSATVARLSPSALYLLSAAGVPEDYVADVLNRAEAGEYVAPSIIRSELKAYRSNKPENCGAEISEPIEHPNDIQCEPISTQNETRGDIAELVEILLQGLSDDDFARVRDIVVSENALLDPHWPQCFRVAFIGATRDCMPPVARLNRL